MKKLFVANYKMNGDINFYQKVNEIIDKTRITGTVILCPPFVYMPFFNIKNKKVLIGSQDISFCDNHQSTGQINANMLKEFDVNYAIIGHSERRELGETDEIVAKKVAYATSNGLIPIVCVGEKNQDSNLEVLSEQVKAALSLVQGKEVIFAYEPIWAIGTGVQPTIEKINEALKLVKNTAKKCGFKVKVLYGGSVNLKNYHNIKTSNADGFLMGGVSLKIDDFIEIVKGE